MDRRIDSFGSCTAPCAAQRPIPSLSAVYNRAMEIPGYTVKRTIGRGGMATAHLAIQESLQREVVLKTVNTSEQESADFLERFLNEGRIVASLRHPNIITIYDIGSASNLVYIAMEYVEGGDLKSLIPDGFSPERALEIIACIGQALDYAHGQGIIHRDVKPANILFRADGTPLLSDFGIAKQTRADAELTSTGTILGSPFYMSPEQSEGYVVDGRTDIYSLGIIFYEMLTGERPYQGDSAIKVIMQHIQSPMPKLPRSLARYQSLLEKMLAKDRDKRIRDAQTLVHEVRQALDALLEESGQRATPTAGAGGIGASQSTPGTVVAPRSKRIVESRRFLAAFAACVVGVLALGGWHVFQEASRPSMLVSRHAPGDTEVTPDASLPPPATAAPSPSIGTTQTPSDGVDQRNVIKALEWLAKNSLREDRLTQPPADNAYYYYSRLLALAPENPVAQQGFADIAERFVVLAEQAFSSKNYPKAQAYITLGLQVDPENEGLASLQSFIDTRERSLLDSVLGLFRNG
jgi:serine/threonine protein kinase